MNHTTMLNNLLSGSVSMLIMCAPLAGVGQPAPSLVELANRALAKNYELANAQLTIQTEQEGRKGIRETSIPHVAATGKYAYLNRIVQMYLPATTLPLLNTSLFDGSETFQSRGTLWTSDISVSAVLFSGTQV